MIQVLIGTLIAKVTRDGITDMQEDIPLGKEYFVSHDRLLFQSWGKVNQPEIAIIRPSVLVADSITGLNPGLIPTELLEFKYRDATPEEESAFREWYKEQMMVARIDAERALSSEHLPEVASEEGSSGTPSQKSQA